MFDISELVGVIEHTDKQVEKPVLTDNSRLIPKVVLDPLTLYPGTKIKNAKGYTISQFIRQYFILIF